MRRLRRHAVPLLVALALSPAPARAETAASDPKAVAIADQVMAALGGRAAWDRLPGLRWTFVASVNDTLRPGRRHAWNKHTGWHRVEGVRRGVPFVFIHRVGAPEGRAWMNGQPIEGDSLHKLLQLAQSLWTNDTYWLLMPYKLRDPGVTLQLAGDTTIAGEPCDRVALSFERVGETPGDHYWVYVNRSSRRVERWDMVLQDDPPAPKSYTWEGWERHGELWFPTAHRQGGVVIFTRDVEAVKRFGEREFSAP